MYISANLELTGICSSKKIWSATLNFGVKRISVGETYCITAVCLGHAVWLNKSVKSPSKPCSICSENG